jgi:antitoxin VapB
MTELGVAMDDCNLVRKPIRVFMNGRSRAIRIPKEFDFEGDEVEISKGLDGCLIVKPIKKTSDLLAFLATLEPLTEEDWMSEIDDSDLLPLDDIKL